MRGNEGFTIIEVLIVIAIMIILALMADPFLSDSLTATFLTTTADQANDALREAQSSAISRKNGGKFGVHFEAAKYVFFEGATYSAVDPNNVEHAFTGQLSISTVSLSPGGACTVATGAGNCDVHFANHRGVPTENGSITFLSADGPTKVLSVNAAGMVDVN
ncbi:MAG: type II secretion system protein [Patescibacteria group bacterium]